MSYHILPIDDIKPHMEENTCDCNPSLEMNKNGEMIFIHTPWDYRDILEQALDNTKTNESLLLYIQYCTRINLLLKEEECVTPKWAMQKLKNAFEKMYAHWREMDVEIIFQ